MSDHKVKFSVIIPVYNAAKTIKRCVDSLEENSFKDFEIVLVEDGSKDNSWDVCEKLSKQYTNIKTIKNDKNRGVSYTRNQGLKNSEGEYFLFCDSDDYVESNYISNFDRVINKCQPDMVICGYVNHDEKYNGRLDVYKFKIDETVKEVSLKQEIKNIHKDLLMQQLWNKAFVGDVIRNNNIVFDESISIGEDFKFILEYLNSVGSDRCVLINKPLYHYMRDQRGSLMYQVKAENVEVSLANLRTLLEYTGDSEESIEKTVSEERDSQKQVNAYLIMHNISMSAFEKRRQILALDPVNGKELYRKNLIVYIKEKVKRMLGN